jgi:hypothetical protein
MQSRRRQRIAIGAVISLVVLPLSACGQATGPAEFTEAPTVLTKRQLSAALLTADDLGRGYVLDRSKDDADDDITDMGCLTELEDADVPEPAAESEARYKRIGKIPFPAVMITAASFETKDQVAVNLDAFREVFETCDNLAFRADGVKFDIAMSTDNVPSVSTIDEQVNARGVGTVTAKKTKVPFGLWMSMARVGNQGVIVMVMDFNTASGRLLTKLTAKAVKRLDAVAHGNAPTNEHPSKPKPSATATPNA